MNVGSKEYQQALNRWAELMRLAQKQRLTFEEAIEMEALHRRLIEAEERYQAKDTP